MSELEPHKRANKRKQPNRHQQISRYQRPFPELTPEDHQKYPEVTKEALRWFLVEHERNWLEDKAQERKIARLNRLNDKQDRIIIDKDAIIANVRRDMDVQANSFEKDIKYLNEAKSSQSNASLILTVMLIFGGAVATIGATFIPTPGSSGLGWLIVSIGIVLQLLGVAIFIIMRPRGSNK